MIRSILIFVEQKHVSNIIILENEENDIRYQNFIKRYKYSVYMYLFNGEHKSTHRQENTPIPTTALRKLRVHNTIIIF